MSHFFCNCIHLLVFIVHYWVVVLALTTLLLLLILPILLLLIRWGITILSLLNVFIDPDPGGRQEGIWHIKKTLSVGLLVVMVLLELCRHRFHLHCLLLQQNPDVLGQTFSTHTIKCRQISMKSTPISWWTWTVTKWLCHLDFCKFAVNLYSKTFNFCNRFGDKCWI